MEGVEHQASLKETTPEAKAIKEETNGDVQPKKRKRPSNARKGGSQTDQSFVTAPGVSMDQMRESSSERKTVRGAQAPSFVTAKETPAMPKKRLVIEEQLTKWFSLTVV